MEFRSPVDFVPAHNRSACMALLRELSCSFPADEPDCHPSYRAHHSVRTPAALPEQLRWLPGIPPDSHRSHDLCTIRVTCNHLDNVRLPTSSSATATEGTTAETAESSSETAAEAASTAVSSARYDRAHIYRPSAT